jgi:hypothetical protein
MVFLTEELLFTTAVRIADFGGFTKFDGAFTVTRTVATVRFYGGTEGD